MAAPLTAGAAAPRRRRATRATALALLGMTTALTLPGVAGAAPVDASGTAPGRAVAAEAPGRLVTTAVPDGVPAGPPAPPTGPGRPSAAVADGIAPGKRLEHHTVANPDGSVTVTTQSYPTGEAGPATGSLTTGGTTATSSTSTGTGEAPGTTASVGPQATMVVTYVGFTGPAQTGFQAAVDIWASRLSSTVPIKVTADFSPLGTNVLGQAGPGRFYVNFPGAPMADVLYPSALADAVTGTDVDQVVSPQTTIEDIDATFSSNFPGWYFGTDGNPGSLQWDFESVVLHELGHGLGFIGSGDVQSGVATYGGSVTINNVSQRLPFPYDLLTQRGDGTPIGNHAGNSALLLTDYQSGDLFLSGTLTNAANGGRPRLFAPATWQPGSSFGHFDETTFPPVSGKALMTPTLLNGEVEHTPDPVTLAVFQDMGWQLAGQPPGPPTGVTASSGAPESATVSWTPPSSDGGSAITGYRITASPGGATVDVAVVTTTTFGGLTGGVTYTFTVQALNALGASTPSSASNQITPAAAMSPGRLFHPVVPFRLLDSRDGTGFSGAVGPNSSKDVAVAGGTVPASAGAVVMNVTVTGGTAGSFLTLYPAGTIRPNAANLNFGPAQTIPNLVTVTIGAGGAVSVYNALGSVHVIADVVGYYDDGNDPTGAHFVGTTPTRILDSRTTTGGWNGQKLPAGTARELAVVGGTTGVPTTATAVVMNVTVTGGTAASFLQAFPDGATQPVTANLLFAANQTVPNLVTVGVGKGGAVDGKILLFNQLGSVHVVADLVGYYDPTAPGGFFHAISPTRMLDTRSPAVNTTAAPIGAGDANTRSVLLGGAPSFPVPGGATAVVMNTTVTGGTQASFLTAFPADVSRPNTANLLFAPGQTVPNLVVVKLSGTGAVDLFNQQGSVNVVGDVAGYFKAT